jgi:MFS family permease
MVEGDIFSQLRALGPIKYILAMLFFAWLVDYADRVVVTIALPLIGKDFVLNHAERGLIVTAFGIAYALFQLPGGFIADRFGARRTMIVAMSAWTGFTALTAVAPTFLSLLGIRFLFGISEGAFPSATFKAVSQNTKPEYRMTANSVVLCSNTMGDALAPMLAAPIIALAGWKFTFLILAIIGVLTVPILAKVIPKVPLVKNTAAAEPKPTIHGVFRSRTVWLACLCFCGYDFISYGLSAWTPSYLMEVKKLNIVAAGALTSIPSLLCVIPVILGGVVFDRAGHKRPSMIIVPVALLTGLFLILMVRSSSVAEFITYQSLSAVVRTFSLMTIFGLSLRTLKPEIAGIGNAVINFGGQIAGALAPFVMGFLADRFGYTAAFCFPFVGVVMMIMSVIFLPKTLDRQLSER